MNSDAAATCRIFVSYRRGDDLTLYMAGVVYERLSREPDLAGQVFLDSQDIAAGDDYRADLRLALENCRCLLVCIGDFETWRKGSNTSLTDEGDWVRQEISKGLEERENETPRLIIPLLFGKKARMPKEGEVPECLSEFCSRQAIGVSEDPRHQGIAMAELISRLRIRSFLPRSRYDLIRDLEQKLQFIEAAGGQLPQKAALAEIFLTSSGLSENESRRHLDNLGGDIWSAIETLGALSGPQVLRFAVGVEAHLKRHDSGGDPALAAPLTTWLDTLAQRDHAEKLDQMEAHFSAAVLQEWRAEAAKSHILRLQVVLRRERTCLEQRIALWGSIQYGLERFRLPGEDFGHAILVPGKDLTLVLEPLFTRLHKWLIGYLGSEVAEHLDPRIEFYLTDDQQNWPLERVLLGQMKLGRWYQVVLRLRQRHLQWMNGELDPDSQQGWQERSHLTENAKLQEESVYDAEDWGEVAEDYDREFPAFRVAKPAESEWPTGPLVDKGCVVGIWSRRPTDKWDRIEKSLYRPDAKLTDLPELLRRKRKDNDKTDSSYWHDLALLFDPFPEDETDLPPFDPELNAQPQALWAAMDL